jgi:uncharacterized protein
MQKKEITFLGRTILFDPETVIPALLDEQKYPAVSSLAIDVIGSCNLKCIYCAESSTMPERQPINLETLDAALQALFDWSKPKSAISIHLGSGEALLSPEIVKEIGMKSRQMAKAQHRALSLYLTTNGTCLNNQVIDWLIADQWNVKVSIDGDQRVHDENRKYKSGRGTYSEVSKAVAVLAQKIPEKFSTTSVICRGADPSRVFYHIASLGVRRIELVPVAAAQDSILQLSESDLESYRKFIADYAQKLANGKPVPINIRFHNRLLRVLGYKNNRTPCGAGRNFFASGPTGEIYPCFRFIGIEKYKLGDIAGISEEQVQDFIKSSGRPYEKRETCRECWAAPLCGGPCFACADLFGLGSPLPQFCEMTLAESEAAIWLVDFLKENNPEELVRLMDTGFLWDTA